MKKEGLVIEGNDIYFLNADVIDMDALSDQDVEEPGLWAASNFNNDGVERE